METQRIIRQLLSQQEYFRDCHFLWLLCRGFALGKNSPLVAVDPLPIPCRLPGASRFKNSILADLGDGHNRANPLLCQKFFGPQNQEQRGFRPNPCRNCRGHYLPVSSNAMADFFHSIITTGGNTLTARVEIAERIFNFVNSSGPLGTAFGLGFKSSLYCYCGWMNGGVHASTPIDGEYIYSFLAGGWVGAILEFVVWIAVLIVILRAMNKGLKEGALSLILWCIFGIRSFVEMSGLLYFESFSMGVYTVVALTPLCYSFLHDHKEIIKSLTRRLPLLWQRPLERNKLGLILLLLLFAGRSVFRQLLSRLFLW